MLIHREKYITIMFHLKSVYMKTFQRNQWFESIMRKPRNGNDGHSTQLRLKITVWPRRITKILRDKRVWTTDVQRSKVVKTYFFLEQITKINRKQVTGPKWYQELSDQQVHTFIITRHSMSEKLLNQWRYQYPTKILNSVHYF